MDPINLSDKNDSRNDSMNLPKISTKDDGFKKSYLEKVSPQELDFVNVNTISVLDLIKDLDIKELIVYKDKPSYIIYLANLSQSSILMLSLPRTQIVSDFAAGLTLDEYTYALNNSTKIILSYSVLIPYLAPLKDTAMVAGKLFMLRNFYQAVYIRGMFGQIINKFIKLFPDTSRLFISTNYLSCIEWLKKQK